VGDVFAGFGVRMAVVATEYRISCWDCASFGTRPLLSGVGRRRRPSPLLPDPAQNHLAGAVVAVQAAHNPGGSQVQILPPLLREALVNRASLSIRRSRSSV
jgi:hypothetical protein